MSEFWEEFKRSPGEPMFTLGMGITCFLGFVVNIWCLVDGRIDFGAELHDLYGISGAILIASSPAGIALLLMSLDSLARVIEKRQQQRKNGDSLATPS